MIKKRVSLAICFALVFFALAPIALSSAAPPVLEKRVFIYRRRFERPPWLPDPPGQGGGGNGEEEGYYQLLGKGVKWKELPVSYVINPVNPQGLEYTFVVSAFSASAEEWDSWTSAELFDDSYAVNYEASWDTETPDYENELVFGDYPEQGVIAVTIIWGYFSGPPGRREIVEFDIMFDTDFVWGDADSNPNVMDLQNIATHEFGHGAGLDDLYKPEASEETMYGYADYGETKKRDLYIGDKAGIQEIYG